MKLTLETTLPCGCKLAYSTQTVAGIEGMFFFMKHAAEVLMHQADAGVNNHKCEGGHAD